jgi:Cyanate lyase C-terminal domain
MSAINFRLDIRREPDPGDDRVIVTLDGKFLPYQWCRRPDHGQDYDDPAHRALSAACECARAGPNKDTLPFPVTAVWSDNPCITNSAYGG